MKIQFDDNSYIEIIKSDNPGKMIITISAQDYENNKKKIVNSVEISNDEFKQLISDVGIK